MISVQQKQDGAVNITANEDLSITHGMAVCVDVLRYRSPAWPSGNRIKVNRYYKPQGVGCRSLYVQNVTEIPFPLRSCHSKTGLSACVYSTNPTILFYPDPA